MEGFLSINWDRAVDDSTNFVLKEHFVSSSASYHQFYGIHQSPWPLESSTAKLSGVEDLSARKWNPTTLKRESITGVGGSGKVLKIEPPKPIPQKSVLTWKEQKDYLFTIIRIKKALMTGSPADPNDVLRLKELQATLKDEMQEYERFAQVTMLQNPSCYSQLNPGVDHYSAEAWQARISEVYQYPADYKLVGSVTLIPKENVKTLDLTLEKTLLEMGRIPSQIFPQLNTIIKIPRNQKLISKKYPANVVNEKPVSKDSNAVKLALKYEVDFVISADTLRLLAGNVGPLFKRAWDLPLTVKQIDSNGGIGKVVFVDEALPPLQMTALEKNKLFSKVALKYHFTNRNPRRCYTYPGSENLPCKAAQQVYSSDDQSADIFDTSDLDVSAMETFGVVDDKNSCSSSLPRSESMVSSVNQSIPVSPNKGRVESEAKRKNIPSATESDSSDEALQIDTGDDSAPSPKKIKTTSSIDQQKISAPSASNLLTSILEGQEKLMQQPLSKEPSKMATSKKKISSAPENPQNYDAPPRNQNVSYRTWDLKANDRSIRLLIRSSVDTAIVTPKKEVRTFLMVPKDEYQPWYGAEVASPAEMAEEWIDLHVRPHCQLLKMRLDAYTGDLIMSEQKDETCVLSEATFQYGNQFRPSNSLHSVWAILSSFRDIDPNPGSYLLRHGINDGISAQVWAASNEAETCSLNLHQLYAAVDPKVTVAPPSEMWMPLDPFTLFPVHRALERPPLTFEPITDKTGGTQSHTTTQNKPKMKGKQPKHAKKPAGGPKKVAKK